MSQYSIQAFLCLRNRALRGRPGGQGRASSFDAIQGKEEKYRKDARRHHRDGDESEYLHGLDETQLGRRIAEYGRGEERERDMIKRDEQAQSRERHSIREDARIFSGYAVCEQEDLRVQEHPLVPTERAGQEADDLRIVQRPERRAQCEQESHDERVGLYEHVRTSGLGEEAHQQRYRAEPEHEHPRTDDTVYECHDSGGVHGGVREDDSAT
jgi:hypothetical protein